MRFNSARSRRPASQPALPAATGVISPAACCRYLVWKHSSLLHLDYGAVMFCAFYLLALLRRMMSEPTTVFYLLYMVVKTAPHVPLALELRQTYLRCAAVV
jgi:hypothetical protein